MLCWAGCSYTRLRLDTKEFFHGRGCSALVGTAKGGDGVTIPGQGMARHGPQSSALVDVVKAQPQLGLHDLRALFQP